MSNSASLEPSHEPSDEPSHDADRSDHRHHGATTAVLPAQQRRVHDKNARAFPPLQPRPLIEWTWQLGRDVAREWKHDRLSDMSAAITYWTIISVPAAVLTMLSLLSSLGSILGTELAQTVEDGVYRFVERVFNNQPTIVAATKGLFQSSNTGAAVVGAVIALYSISRAFGSVIRALDLAYDVEKPRSWWYARIVAIVLGFITFGVIAASAAVLTVLPQLPLHGLGRLLSVPIVIASVTLWVAVLYHVGPHRRTPWKSAWPGAILTAVGWLLATQGFALYMRLTAHRNNVQSGVGAVLLVLTLMHLLSTVLLAGAEVNEVLLKREQAEAAAKATSDTK